MIPSGIVEGLIMAAITGVFVVLWYFVKRFLDEQIQMNKTLTTISTQIGAVVERVGKLETWAEMREEVDDERHDENKRSIRDLWGAMNKRKG